MSATPPAASHPAPAKSKKLIVIVAVIALLAIAAAAAFVFLSQRQHSSLDDDEEGHGPAAMATVPTFLPLDNLVVNLADPGGDRFAQIGITLELADEKTATMVKQFLPSIRNGILLLVSQRTSEELLAREGKEQLAADVLNEVATPLGFGSNANRRGRDEEAEEEGDRRRQARGPVRRVLFSSFIIQ